MDENSKKINFEDFLKIYPPLTPKVDPSNYKTFNNYFKRRDNLKQKDSSKNFQMFNIDEKDEIESKADIEINKEEEKEDEWYLIDKGI